MAPARGDFSQNATQIGEQEIPGGHAAFLGLPLRAKIRIPAPEGVLPLLVEHTGSYPAGEDVLHAGSTPWICCR